ncbi:anaerobic ribonucleoside-triphosphate reductase activating protein [Chitinimonas sp. PSY-7]|uniref:anaerobic ribonucleoside-triphosphate reductase activating protein n=1 Tax=Chitinimonas sp. PSY-7 TaxID=3459088 RepID=UPI00403FFD99
MSAASSPNSIMSEISPLADWHIPLRLLAAEPAQLGPDEPALAGLVPFSSVDWPGHLAAVLFIGGCPWRCHYCHNPHLQERACRYSWAAMCNWLQSRRGLLDGVVFSGGEPLSEAALPEMIKTVKTMGFKVALHSAGIYPNRLAAVLAYLDWVGLDIKTDPEGYDALTGRPRSRGPTGICLEMLLAAGSKFECRTTWSPAWLSEARLLKLAKGLAESGVRHYAVQRYRSSPDVPPDAVLSIRAQSQLAEWFEQFEYR